MPYPTPTGPAGHAAMGAVDEQALKRLRYERALDAACGIPPEESQHPGAYAMDPAQAGAGMQPSQPQQWQPQPGMVPSGQAQQPGMAGRTPAFQDILRAVISQPGMAQHLEGIDLDGDGIPDVPPPPQDPMGRMQWQAMMQNRQMAVQAAGQRRARRKELNNHTLLAVLQASDPLFPEVYSRLQRYFQSMPPRVLRTFEESMERQPAAFLEIYKELRDFVEKISRFSGSANSIQPMPEPGNADPRARIRQAVAGRMSPPDLARAGVLDDDRPAQARRAAEMAALKARVKAGQAREGDLLRYLELSGV